MNYESAIDELTDDIKRKASLLDTAAFDEIPARCEEIRDLLDKVEALSERAQAEGE